jgi:hypothetical protein
MQSAWRMGADFRQAKRSTACGRYSDFVPMSLMLNVASGSRPCESLEANMDERSKEYAPEYALILAMGALLMAIVFINLHTHFIA